MSIRLFHNEKLLLKTLRYVHALFRGLVILLFILILTNTYLITVQRVDGHSMDPTLKNGQLLPVNLTAYWFKAPQTNDIVIVRYAGDASIRFVKRIIYGPGENVSYHGSIITLTADQYFVEGDNRDFSTDSRAYGPITKSQIMGKVLGVK